MTPAEAPVLRAWKRVAWLLLALGILWLLVGVVGGIWVVKATPIPPPDRNDGGAGALLVPVIAGTMVAILTAPSLVFILLGAALLATPRAAPFALGLCALTLVRAGWWLGASVVDAGLGVLRSGLALAGIAILLVVIVAGASLLVGYARRVDAASTIGRVLRRYAWPLPLALPLLAACAGAAFERVMIRNSPDDRGPAAERSIATLIQQDRPDGGPEHDELLRRGPKATRAIIRMLQSCSMNPSRSRTLYVGNMCGEGGIGTLLLDLADLGGPDALAEQRRWVRATDADTVVRDHAALSLGRAGDAASVPDIAALLDVGKPVGFPWRRLDEVMTALVALHAKTEVLHIVATIRRLGPLGPGARNGLEAICDLDTLDGWNAYRDFATSPDAQWRREALGIFVRRPLPAPLTQLFLDALDDPDREARGYACLAVVGPGACAHYPQLCARTHGQPCTEYPASSGRTDLIRAAIEGRPVP